MTDTWVLRATDRTDITTLRTTDKAITERTVLEANWLVVMGMPRYTKDVSYMRLS
jgi:hypothetical protein